MTTIYPRLTRSVAGDAQQKCPWLTTVAEATSRSPRVFMHVSRAAHTAPITSPVRNAIPAKNAGSQSRSRPLRRAGRSENCASVAVKPSLSEACVRNGMKLQFRTHAHLAQSSAQLARSFIVSPSTNIRRSRPSTHSYFFRERLRPNAETEQGNPVKRGASTLLAAGYHG